MMLHTVTGSRGMITAPHFLQDGHPVQRLVHFLREELVTILHRKRGQPVEGVKFLRHRQALVPRQVQ